MVRQTLDPLRRRRNLYQYHRPALAGACLLARLTTLRPLARRGAFHVHQPQLRYHSGVLLLAHRATLRNPQTVHRRRAQPRAATKRLPAYSARAGRRPHRDYSPPRPAPSPRRAAPPQRTAPVPNRGRAASWHSAPRRPRTTRPSMRSRTARVVGAAKYSARH